MCWESDCTIDDGDEGDTRMNDIAREIITRLGQKKMKKWGNEERNKMSSEKERKALFSRGRERERFALVEL